MRHNLTIGGAARNQAACKGLTLKLTHFLAVFGVCGCLAACGGTSSDGSPRAAGGLPGSPGSGGSGSGGTSGGAAGNSGGGAAGSCVAAGCVWLCEGGDCACSCESGAGGGGNGGSTGSLGGTGGGAAAGGTAGSQCATLNAARSAALRGATACSPELGGQCSGSATVPNQCGCPILVASPDVGRLAQDAYDAWVAAGCGPFPCGAACLMGTSGSCQPPGPAPGVCTWTM